MLYFVRSRNRKVTIRAFSKLAEMVTLVAGTAENDRVGVNRGLVGKRRKRDFDKAVCLLILETIWDHLYNLSIRIERKCAYVLFYRPTLLCLPLLL